MRPIKFRVWERQKKRFSYIQFNGNILSWPNPGYLGSEILDNEAIKFPSLFDGIQQFTGLKDKKGLSYIYEGDIILLDGTLGGNKYENEVLLKEEANLVVEGMGTKAWSDTEQAARERGCFYAE